MHRFPVDAPAAISGNCLMKPDGVGVTTHTFSADSVDSVGLPPAPGLQPESSLSSWRARCASRCDPIWSYEQGSLWLTHSKKSIAQIFDHSSRFLREQLQDFVDHLT